MSPAPKLFLKVYLTLLNCYGVTLMVSDHATPVASISYSISSTELSVIRLSMALIHIGIHPQKVVTESRLHKYSIILELYAQRLVEDFQWTSVFFCFQWDPDSVSDVSLQSCSDRIYECLLNFLSGQQCKKYTTWRYITCNKGQNTEKCFLRTTLYPSFLYFFL